MPVDYTYLKKPKEFEPKVITDATGIEVTATLAIPQNAIVITTPNPIDEKQIQLLDIFMNDFGYERSTV